MKDALTHMRDTTIRLSDMNMQNADHHHQCTPKRIGQTRHWSILLCHLCNHPSYEHAMSSLRTFQWLYMTCFDSFTKTVQTCQVSRIPWKSRIFSRSHLLYAHGENLTIFRLGIVKNNGANMIKLMSSQTSINETSYTLCLKYFTDG